MSFTKKNIRIILLIITFASALFAASQNLPAVLGFFGSALSVVMPVITGLCLAFLLNILLTLLETKVFAFLGKSKKKAVRRLLRPVSLIATILLVLGFLALLLFIIIPQLGDTVSSLAAKISVYYKRAVEWIDAVILKYGLEYDTSMLKNPQLDFNRITEFVKDFFSGERGSSILNTTMGVTASVVSGIINFALGAVIAVYVLAQKEKIGRVTHRFLKAALSGKAYEKVCEIASVTYESFSNFIAGQFTDALLLGILCFIGLTILRIPYASVVAVIIGVFALIPVVGPIIGEAISCFIIFTESPWKALFFLIFIVLLQAVDNNLIYPKIVGKSVGLPGVLVLVAVIVGGNLGGILGVLTGVPLASALYAIVLKWISDREKGKANISEKSGSKDAN